jgi:hypothetical protein
MKFLASAPARGPSPRRRWLADAVVTSTVRLVDLVQRNAWGDVSATLAARRSLLIALERHAAEGPAEADSIAALRGAVLESERVIAQLCPPRVTGQA